MKVEAKTSKLPSFFRPLFWSYDFSSVEPERNKRIVIVNTINYGSWKHWLWIINFYGRRKLRGIIEQIPETEFRPPALKLICLLLGIKKMKYVSRAEYIRIQKKLEPQKRN